MAEPGEELSKREQEILECVVAGRSNKEIAAELHISQNTVKVHLRNIYVKFDISSRTEAATEAIRLGLVPIPGSTVTTTDRPLPPADDDLQPDEAEAVAIEDMEDTAVSDPTSPVEIETTFVTHPHNRWRLVVGILLLGVVAIIAILAVNNRVTTEKTTPFQEVSLPNNWVQSRPIPFTSAKAAVASFGLDLFLISGEQDGELKGDVYLYDTVNLEWENKAQKPTAVSEATAAELGGVIFVPGGRTSDGQPTDVVEVYSPTNNAWGNVASLPTPTTAGLTVSDGGLIYFIGGSDGTNALNTLYVYDPGADSWRPLTRMNHPRAFASGGVIGNNLYVVGGFDGQNELDICEVYNLTENSWDTCSSLLASRGGAGTAVLINKLYVIGGGMETDNAINYSEVYDPTTDTWSLVNTPILAEDDKWANVGVTSVENRIYTLGGYRRNNQPTNDNTAYAPLIYQTFIPAAAGGE